MERKVSFILVVLIVFLSFNYSLKNKLNEKEYYRNIIIGDCFNDSILFKIDEEMQELGWYRGSSELSLAIKRFNELCYIKGVMVDSNKSLAIIHSILFINKNLVSTKSTSKNSWVIEFSNLEESKTLSTNKKDTLFWNVIDILKQYCDVRDSTYQVKDSLRFNRFKMND